MGRLRQLAGYRVSKESTDIRIGQLVYFAGSPAMLLLGVRATTRLAGTPGEVLLGVMGAATLSLVLIAIGLVLPQASRTAD